MLLITDVRQRLLNRICNSKLLRSVEISKLDCEKFTLEHAIQTNNVYDFVDGFDHKEWDVDPDLLATFFTEIHEGKPPPKLIERQSNRLPKHITKNSPREDIKSLNKDDRVTLYHGTDRKTACMMTKYGILGKAPPPVRYFPGEKFDPGIYASPDQTISQSFGHCVLRFDTKAAKLHPPFWYYVDAWQNDKERMDKIEKSYSEIHPNSYNPMLTDSLLGTERQALFYGTVRPEAAVCKLGTLIKDDNEFMSIEQFRREECR